jgi:hypothetical protein
MRHLLNFMLCGVLSVGLAVSSALGAAPADGRVDGPPWVISNGRSDADLYMPRDVQQAYVKGTRSPDGRPGPNFWQNHAEHPSSRLTILCGPRPQSLATTSTARPRSATWR